MWRENRRVQAMSWGSAGSSGNNEDAPPPPKPSRTPATLISSSTTSSTLTRGGKAEQSNVQPLVGPTTYLVAPNSEVLAQLMRENQERADAGMYTAPASVFNTYTVEFVHPDSSTPLSSPQHRSKGKNRKQQQQSQPLYANVVANGSGQTSPSLPSSPPPPAPSGSINIPVAKRDVRLYRMTHTSIWNHFCPFFTPYLLVVLYRTLRRLLNCMACLIDFTIF
jgi:focal adhesion kinase 1